MRIRYAGGRPYISTCLSRRGQYYFGPENGFTINVQDPSHIKELLKSVQHRFEVAPEIPKPKVEKPKEKPKKEEPKKSKGKGGKKNA